MDALVRVEQLRHLSSRPWPDPWVARQALLSASGTVRGHCGWWIAPVRATTAVLSGDGSPILGLPCLRVLSVESVTVDGQPVAADGYRVSQNGLLLRRGGAVWPDDLANVEVRYVGGYDDTPEEIVAVVCAVADRGAAPTGIAAQSVEDQSVTYARAADGGGLTRGEEAILGRGYVVPPRA